MVINNLIEEGKTKMRNFQSRVMVSFSGRCPINCKHCYTFEQQSKKIVPDKDEINDIVDSLENKQPFDIIYISHDRENFIDEEAGVLLAEQLFSRYHKSIIIITRKVLQSPTIQRLSQLSKHMGDDNLLFAVAISIPANHSYYVTEDVAKIDTPLNRCDLLKRLHDVGITTILLARPIYPDSIIPVSEIIEIITNNKAYIDAVVSSGLAVNEQILNRINMSSNSFEYLPGDNNQFLVGSSAENIKYIDVHNELAKIEKACAENDIPFSTHSLNALNLL